MKRLCVLLLAVLLMLPGGGMAEAEPFRKEALRDYQVGIGKAWTLQFRDIDRVAGTWYYQVYNGEARIRENNEALGSFYADILFMLYGNGDDAFPNIEINGYSKKPFALHKIMFLLDEKVYVLDLTMGKGKLPKNENVASDGMTFQESISLGMEGIAFFRDLYEAGGVYTVRLYYGQKEYVEAVQPPMEVYSLFYEGLMESNYLDASGNVQPTVERWLRGIDKQKDIPTLTVQTASDQIWPVITPAPTPLANVSSADAAQYETLSIGHKGDIILEVRTRMHELGYFAKKPNQTEFTRGMLEYLHAFQEANGLPVEDVITPEMQALLFSEYVMAKPTATPRPTASPKPTVTPFVEPTVPIRLTGMADWGKSSGVPWFKMEMKNDSKVLTISSVTFIYTCTDAKNKPLMNTQTGTYETYAEAEVVIRPGRKVDPPRTKVDAYEGVKAVNAMLYSYTLEDGTEVIVPERERVDWVMDF